MPLTERELRNRDSRRSGLRHRTEELEQRRLVAVRVQDPHLRSSRTPDPNGVPLRGPGREPLRRPTTTVTHHIDNCHCGCECVTVPLTEQKLSEFLDSLRVHRGDSTSVEVKRARGGLPGSLDTTVCAFANMPEGGRILLGIDEASGFRVTGIANPAELAAALVNQARTAVTPTPHIDTYSVNVAGVPVLVADVSPLPLMERPATVRGQAYLRQADGDYTMQEHELRMLRARQLLEPQFRDHDKQEVPGQTIDDLVPALVEKYITSVRAGDRRLADRTDAEILRRTGVLTASGEPTLAGFYALGDYPQGLMPSLTVTAAVQFPTGTGARNRDLQHFAGPIPALLEDIMIWCHRNLTSARTYREDGHMTERPELPLTAVRELVANALVHRDLGPESVGMGKSIQIRITSTALMVISPGGLRGISLKQLESDDHAQSAVNQHLYAIARRLRTEDGLPIIEEEGGGIREVFRAAAQAGLRPPTLIDTGVQFKAMLWRPEPPEATVQTPPAASPEKTPAPRKTGTGSQNEIRVLASLHHLGDASLRAVQEDTGLTARQVRYALRGLVSSGSVEMVGKQGVRGTRYQLTGGSTRLRSAQSRKSSPKGQKSS